MARKVMNAFKQVIDAIFDNVDKLAICAQSASKAFSLSVFGNEMSLVKIFKDCKDPRSKLLRRKVLSISGTSYECMAHPCSLLHKDKAAGGKESGRMLSKGKRVAEDLIARGLAKTKWEASKMLQKYITDEIKENKASNIQKKYSSCCELNLASDIADALVSTGLYTSKHQASKSTEMIETLMDQEDFTREKASSIALRYEVLLDPETQQKRDNTKQDNTWDGHYKEMHIMWTKADPNVKVAVEVDQGVKHVLYVQKKKAPALYLYVQYLLSLSKEDSRYITATTEFNIHLHKEAATVLRKRRAKKTR